jgi:hypothetical protein
LSKYLIWIAGLRGPEPQLWPEKAVDGAGKPKSVLATHTLDDYDRRSLRELAIAYPAPVNE